MFENKHPTVVTMPIFRLDLISNENLFTSKLIQVHHEVNPPFWSKSGLPCQANQTWSRGKCANNSKHLFQSDCGITWIHIWPYREWQRVQTGGGRNVWVRTEPPAREVPWQEWSAPQKHKSFWINMKGLIDFIHYFWTASVFELFFQSYKRF